MPSNVAGILVCIVCGIVDATCFVALGGTFAGLMTGNLILLGVSLDASNDGVAAAVFLYPLAGYALGALLAGLMFKFAGYRRASQQSLWLSFALLAFITILVWTLPVTANSASGWLVVVVCALYMGFQSAALYLSKRVTITTNVMTSTMTSFLADYPMQLTKGNISWHKLLALLGFLLGVTIGASLATKDIRLSFLISVCLALVAVFKLSKPDGATEIGSKA